MKWLIGCLLALVLVSAAFAGEDPYIAIVGNDIDFNPFYFSQKHQQFMFDQTIFDVDVCFGSWPPIVSQTRVCGADPCTDGCEQFRANKPINQPEICDVNGNVVDFGKGEFEYFGEPNAVVTKQNAGWFEWWIRLPKKPSGEINICIQCGVLKPNTFTPFTGFLAVEECAAETGERIGTGFCTNDQKDPNENPIVASGLPKLEVIAYPGPYAPVWFDPFHLTAFKNPSNYSLSTTWYRPDGADASIPLKEKLDNSDSLQILDGTSWSRILLKSCMDKCVVAKIPVTDQWNYLGESEFDLEAGDLIQIRMTVPIYNTVDIYCNAQSASLRGIGESPF